MKLKKGQLVVILNDMTRVYSYSPGKVGKLALGEKDAAEYLGKFTVFKSRNIEDRFHLLEMPDSIVYKIPFLLDFRKMLDNFKEEELGDHFFIHTRRILLPIPKNEVRPPYPEEREYVQRMWNKIKKGEM